MVSSQTHLSLQKVNKALPALCLWLWKVSGPHCVWKGHSVKWPFGFQWAASLLLFLSGTVPSATEFCPVLPTLKPGWLLAWILHGGDIQGWTSFPLNPSSFPSTQYLVPVVILPRKMISTFIALLILFIIAGHSYWAWMLSCFVCCSSLSLKH